MAHIINRPHAIYCNGELVGIITNPDPLGNLGRIVSALAELSEDIELMKIGQFDIQGIADAIDHLPEALNTKEEEIA